MTWIFGFAITAGGGEGSLAIALLGGCWFPLAMTVASVLVALAHLRRHRADILNPSRNAHVRTLNSQLEEFRYPTEGAQTWPRPEPTSTST
ncbi:hypothetical protein [Streptantibioticus ferralitis]|uniref:Uncharacterized protein n=1 Tax=Streptantibioticus ferralitis TaxID=236510 RepID=A0ABT5Z130_9ACTN|nr:hypothetical protein [Streptantibioticus ferralitis]MDF2257546.1 hypothetical protein [Streptantibioticus ferralitis]